MTMQNLPTLIGVFLFVTLTQSVSLSDYLRFIPKYGKQFKGDSASGSFIPSYGHHKETFPSAGSRQGSSPPPFCNKLSCPKYEVVRKISDHLELRQYSTSRWVSTNVVGLQYRQASSTDFMRLFDYISGDNVAKEKIAMTAPVLTRIIPGAGPACETNFTMSFFVATEKPPQPKDSKVFLQEFAPLRVYVRWFSGYATDIDTWLDQAKLLAEDLNNSSLTYQTDYYYIAGYDSPFKPFNRHNEVWFLA